MAIITDGLQLYLNANGYVNPTSTWSDLSGNNRNATLNNFNYTTSSGWGTNELIHDGINDTVTIPISGMTVNKFSIEFYGNLLSSVDGEYAIVGLSNGTSNARLMHWGADADISFQGSGWNNINFIGVCPRDSLDHHIVFTMNGTTMNLYIDGVYKGTKTDNSVSWAITNIFIGSQNSTTYYSKQKTKIVRVYNLELTQVEVTQNYNDATSGLILHLDGSDFTNTPNTTTWIDKSGMNNNAIPSGFSYTTSDGSDGSGNVIVDGNDICTIPTLTSLPYAQYTIEICFSMDVLGSYLNFITHGEWNDGWALGTTSWETINFSYDGNGSSSNATLSINTFYHCTVLVDNTNKNIKIYLNGVLDSSFPITNDVTNPNYPVRLFRGNENDYWASGKLKVARIYNRLLTTQEITDNYNTIITPTTDTNISSVVATANAQAYNPSLTRILDKTINSLLSTATATVPNPNIIVSKDKIVNSVSATVTATVPNTGITVLKDKTINSVVATSNATAIIPNITVPTTAAETLINSVLATATATSLTLNIIVVQNETVNSVLATTTALALNPSLVVAKDKTINSVLATTTALTLNPNLVAEKDKIMNSVLAYASVLVANPTVIAIETNPTLNINIPLASATSESYILEIIGDVTTRGVKKEVAANFVFQDSTSIGFKMDVVNIDFINEHSLNIPFAFTDVKTVRW